MASSWVDRGEELAKTLLGRYNGGWRVANVLPAYVKQACYRIAILAGDAEYRFVDGLPFSHNATESPGFIVCFTDDLFIVATITSSGDDSYDKSGATVQAISRSSIKSLAISEFALLDTMPEGGRWPQGLKLSVTYAHGEFPAFTFPMSPQPSSEHRTQLMRLVPSLIGNLSTGAR